MYEEWLMSNLPSKESVKKAGKLIRNFSFKEHSFNDIEKAITILSSWRTVHEVLMSKFVYSLKRNLDCKNGGIILSRRLKRMPSIINKLKRFTSMSASRIQDIAGIRIVVNSVTEVYAISNVMKKFYSENCKTAFILKDVDDYISSPKDDGYRSIHMIFQHTGRYKSELKGLFVEVQIRTRLQHTWSTAVETFDLLNKSAIKAGKGDPEHKNFFILSSAAFAIKENSPVQKNLESSFKDDIHKQLKLAHNELNIIDKLLGVRVLARDIKEYQHKASVKDPKYFLLKLDIDAKTLQIASYEELEEAQEDYQIQEQIVEIENKHWEVVLISLDNIKKLKSAYPNYLLDASLFVKEIQGILNKK